MAESSRQRYLIKCLLALAVIIVFVYASQITIYMVGIANLDGRFSKISAFNRITISSQYSSRRYALEIDKSRIDRLFAVLRSHEPRFESVFARLNLFTFTSLIDRLSAPTNRALAPDHFFNAFEPQIRKYFELSEDGQNVRVNEKFVDYVRNKSEFYFVHPRDQVVPQPVEINQADDSVLPVLLSAADHKYYKPMLDLLANIREFFPDYKLIVYDIGLDSEQHEHIKTTFNCELRKFDFDAYKDLSPHVTNLNTYTWKPLLIQETLKEHRRVIYVDSSIRFKSNKIRPIMEACSDLGVMARYIESRLLCFTHPSMFKWFDEERANYKDYLSAEANFILFDTRNLLTRLIMKAWVTCTLSNDCIAPKGSHIYGGIKNWLTSCSTCGCHRFDQDALTISISYFYAQPLNHSVNPAYVFTQSELYFYSINRRNVKSYIIDQLTH